MKKSPTYSSATAQFVSESLVDAGKPFEEDFPKNSRATRLKSGPQSGWRQIFPELDRAAWFSMEEARARILKGQPSSLTVCWKSVRCGSAGRNLGLPDALRSQLSLNQQEAIMGFGKGALLWLIGIPLPIILLLALFMHH